MENTRDRGKKAEEFAINFLQSKNYKIIDKNYHSRFGEIDIIAKKGSYIHFIEVKYRKNTLNGYPREAVSKSKQKKIKLTSLTYIQEKCLSDSDFSFDVIEIIGKDINFIKNAF